MMESEQAAPMESDENGVEISADVSRLAAPIQHKNLLLSNPPFLERFDNAYVRWKELGQKGVRFPKGLAYAITQIGITNRREIPLPFYAIVNLTVTPDNFSLFSTNIPKQELTTTRFYGLHERNYSTEYHNLDTTVQLTIEWSLVSSISWFTAKPYAEIGRNPPSQNYIAIDTPQQLLLLQAAALSPEPLSAAPQAIAEHIEAEHAAAKAKTQTLYKLLRAVAIGE